MVSLVRHIFICRSCLTTRFSMSCATTKPYLFKWAPARSCAELIVRNKRIGLGPQLDLGTPILRSRLLPCCNGKEMDVKGLFIAMRRRIQQLTIRKSFFQKRHRMVSEGLDPVFAPVLYACPTEPLFLTVRIPSRKGSSIRPCHGDLGPCPSLFSASFLRPLPLINVTIT